MKTQLLKSMPHVPLQKLKPEGQDRNAPHVDQTTEDPNAVGGGNNKEVPVNGVENIEAEETAATFQYGRHDAANNDGTLGATSQEEIFGKIFRKLVNKRGNKQEADSVENAVQLTSFGTNESSESESEDFQDATPLVDKI